MNEKMTEAERYTITDNAFKAVGKLSDQMLGELKLQHPDRYRALNVAVQQGMDMAVTFRFGEDSRAVLQMYGDTGQLIDLATVNVKIRDPRDRAQ